MILYPQARLTQQQQENEQAAAQHPPPLLLAVPSAAPRSQGKLLSLLTKLFLYLDWQTLSGYHRRWRSRRGGHRPRRPHHPWPWYGRGGWRGGCRGGWRGGLARGVATWGLATFHSDL